MAAYVLVNIEITDPDGFKQYQARFPQLMAAHGGKYIARGGKVERVEGSWLPHRMILMEFPSLEHVQRLLASPEYKDVQALRARSTNSDLLVIEGVS